MQTISSSQARLSGLSVPTIGYLIGLAAGSHGMFMASTPETIKFSLGRMLVALALATVPQLVLNRNLNWSRRDHPLEQPFGWAWMLGDMWRMVRGKEPLTSPKDFTPLQESTFERSKDMGFAVFTSFMYGLMASSVFYILTLLPWEQL